MGNQKLMGSIQSTQALNLLLHLTLFSTPCVGFLNLSAFKCETYMCDLKFVSSWSIHHGYTERMRLKWITENLDNARAIDLKDTGWLPFYLPRVYYESTLSALKRCLEMQQTITEAATYFSTIRPQILAIWHVSPAMLRWWMEKISLNSRERESFTYCSDY